VLNRLFIVLSTASVLVILAGVLFWYLAYGADLSGNGTVSVPGLESQVDIEWSNDVTVRLSGKGLSGLAVGLGYAHATSHAWEMLLYRQAALGRLSEWFGSGAEQEDMLTRLLQIGTTSKEAYERLTPTDRDLLEQYALGVNRAFADEKLPRRKAIVLLGLDPEKWKPWDSIAVERLWGWLGARTETIASSPAGTGKSITSLLRYGDRQLRSRLHLFGFDNSFVATDKTNLIFRMVTGNSGRPPFLAFEYAFDSGSTIRGMSVPGTLVVPIGQRDSDSWAFLLTTQLTLSSTAGRAVRMETSYDRMIGGSGEEMEIRILRAGNDLPLIDPGESIRAGRIDLLEWSGLEHDTDMPSWLGLLRGTWPVESSSTGMVDFTGMTVSSRRDVEIFGRDERHRTLANGWSLVANSEILARIETRSNELIASTEALGSWEFLSDNLSIQSKQDVRSLSRILSSDSTLSDRERTALSYLENWNFRFEASSIAASIVETMNQQIEEKPGADSIIGRRRYLGKSVDDLSKRFGKDMSAWRWETVQNRTLAYPGWMATSDFANIPRTVRSFGAAFRPIHVPGTGHPSTLLWGARSSSNPTDLYSRSDLATVAVSGVLRTSPDRLEYEMPSLNWSSFLGQYDAQKSFVRETISATEPLRFDHRIILRPNQ